MRALVLLVFLGLSFAFDIKNPQGEPANQGRSLGQQFRDVYGGRNKGDRLKQKLLDPASSSSPSSQYTMPKKGGGEQTLSGKPVFCGQGEPKEERVFARVDINGNTVSFSYASDPYTGNLDRSISYSGRYLCPKGFCQNYSLVSGEYKYTGCQEVYLDGGIFRLRSVQSLDNCVDTQKLPQDPTFFVAYVQELVNYYHSINKPITQSKVEERGWTVSFYGGKTECEGVNKSPPQSQYYKNPYVMPDHAIYYYMTCDPQRDGTCSAIKGIMEQGQSSSTTCVISREVDTNPNTGRTDRRICTPNAKLFPDGYNESSPICYGGQDRFFSFSSSFWLECSPDGKSYKLKGWGFWEGAPCGSTEPFPPKPQIEVLYPLDQNVDWVEIGRLSVNRRRGGEGLSSGDKASPQELECVSNDPTPYKVWLKNTFYPNVPNNVLELRVDNAPACNNFRFSRVQGLVGEIVSDCDQYDKQGCKVINEWWVDANGNRIQVIKNGQPVQQLSGCVEILRDEGQKVWSSVVQTPQSPPQNCNFPPKTCKVINGQSECRQWWQKIREYQCLSRSMPNPNLSNVEKVFSSTNYDPSSGELSWSERQGRCEGGTCTPITRREGRYVCPLNQENFTLQYVCKQNCYEQRDCNSVLNGYKCSKTGTVYADYQQCSASCKEQAPCNTVYFCPLNNNTYNSSQDCLNACNNCQETGTCSAVSNTYYLCSANGQRYSTQDQCQSACSQTGSCNQEYYCSEGSLSGQNCVINPTGTCPSGYSLSGNVCVANPTCSLGSYNSQRDRCEITPTCPSGYTWNSLRNRCEINPSISCPSGTTWNASRQRCETNPTCPSGYTWNSSRKRCEINPTCLSPGVWNPSTGRCETNPTLQCVFSSASCAFYHPNVGVYYVYPGCYGYYCAGSNVFYISGVNVELYCYTDANFHQAYYYVYETGEYNSGSSSASGCYSGSSNFYIWVYAWSSYMTVSIYRTASYQNTCPSGYTLSGSICVRSGSCPSGSTYDSTNKVCYRSGTCPSGTTYDSTNGVCYANGSVSCPSGSTYDSANGVCYVSGQCPSGSTYDGTNGVCYANAVCPSGGSLNPSTDRCEANAVLTCPSGWTLQNNQCVKPAQTRYRCSLDGQVYSDQSSCQNACRVQGTCSQQTETLYRCSFGGDYQDLSSCTQACRRSLSNCCQAEGLCTANNNIYPLDQCPNQCFRYYSCDAVYKYVCPLTGSEYSDSNACSQNCRRYVDCVYQMVDITMYLCSKDMTYYSSNSACLSACSSGGCTQGEKKAFVGTAEGGWEEGSKCLSSEARNCLVKYPTGSRPAYEFLVKECDKSGDSWRCPLSGNEQLVEDCKCASEMKMGFGIATSTLSIIYEALRDRKCE